MVSLTTKAWISLAVLGIVLGLVLFVSAGTVCYWQGWVYLAIFMGASAASTLDLQRRDPALLERRMRGGPTAEPRPAQKVIMLGASAGFIVLFVLSALDHRYRWSQVPLAISVAGDLLVVIGFGLVMRVYRENTFSSATIEVADHQRVISTGPYAIVRHPMYASALLYVAATPLALGSYWGLLGFAVTLAFIIWRLLDEERFLATSLPGYPDYQQRVRRRLVPFVW
jgi:protein-S-isoprenylcysteine O-methyltransferase Ste14